MRDMVVRTCAVPAVGNGRSGLKSGGFAARLPQDGDS